MTVNDLIKDKDYDYIEWRATVPEKLGGGDIFTGVSKSINGELISLDGDSYSNNTEILEYEEWENPKEGIEHGLTVIYEGKFREP